jgi:hypothetical protein
LGTKEYNNFFSDLSLFQWVSWQGLGHEQKNVGEKKYARLCRHMDSFIGCHHLHRRMDVCSARGQAESDRRQSQATFDGSNGDGQKSRATI